MADKIRKTHAGGTTTLTGSIDATATSIPLASTAGYPTDTEIDVALDAVNAAGEITDDKMEIVTGKVTATGLVDCTRGVGGMAQVHLSGAIAQPSINSAANHNDLADAVLSTTKQSGGLKDKVVKKASLADASVDTDALVDNCIKTSKIADSAVTTEKYADGSIEEQHLAFNIKTYTPSQGGGTGYYIDLGGIKMAWGITAASNVAANSAKYVSLPPSGFFSSIKSATFVPWGSTTARWQASAAPTTTLLGLWAVDTFNGCAFSWFAIGT